MVMYLDRALATVTAFMFRNGIASGNHVEVHIRVRRYSFPVRVFGRGPTQSTKIRVNGSSMAGMGIRGARGIP